MFCNTAWIHSREKLAQNGSQLWPLLVQVGSTLQTYAPRLPRKRAIGRRQNFACRKRSDSNGSNNCMNSHLLPKKKAKSEEQDSALQIQSRTGLAAQPHDVINKISLMYESGNRAKRPYTSWRLNLMTVVRLSMTCKTFYNFFEERGGKTSFWNEFRAIRNYEVVSLPKQETLKLVRI